MEYFLRAYVRSTLGIPFYPIIKRTTFYHMRKGLVGARDGNSTA